MKPSVPVFLILSILCMASTACGPKPKQKTEMAESVRTSELAVNVPASLISIFDKASPRSERLQFSLKSASIRRVDIKSNYIAVDMTFELVNRNNSTKDAMVKMLLSPGSTFSLGQANQVIRSGSPQSYMDFKWLASTVVSNVFSILTDTGAQSLLLAMPSADTAAILHRNVPDQSFSTLSLQIYSPILRTKKGTCFIYLPKLDNSISTYSASEFNMIVEYPGTVKILKGPEFEHGKKNANGLQEGFHQCTLSGNEMTRDLPLFFAETENEIDESTARRGEIELAMTTVEANDIETKRKPTSFYDQYRIVLRKLRHEDVEKAVQFAIGEHVISPVTSVVGAKTGSFPD